MDSKLRSLSEGTCQNALPRYEEVFRLCSNEPETRGSDRAIIPVTSRVPR
jgi:hypothetical protein